MQLARRCWIFALCTLGVLAGTSTLQAQQYKLLPNDTEGIVTINVQQLLKSEVAKANKEILDIGKTKLNEMLDDKNIGKWLKKADFDLFRDLTSITVATPGGGRNPQEAFLLLEGKFDAEKIESAATEASNEAGGGLKIVKISDVKALEISPQGEKSIYLGVLNKKTMIATSTKADFAEAVARLKGTKEPAFKAGVKSLLETVNNKQTLSAIMTGAMLAKLAENVPQNKGPIDLKQLDGLSMTLTVQKNIDFQIGMNTPDNKTASKYADLVKFGLFAIRPKVAEAAKKDEKFIPAREVFDTITAQAQGSNLVIRGQVSFATLGKILSALPMPQ